jgi:hypothetical protein
MASLQGDPFKVYLEGLPKAIPKHQVEQELVRLGFPTITGVHVFNRNVGVNSALVTLAEPIAADVARQTFGMAAWWGPLQIRTADKPRRLCLSLFVSRTFTV